VGKYYFIIAGLVKIGLMQEKICLLVKLVDIIIARLVGYVGKDVLRIIGI
jgi:hypothetical protein